MIPFLDLYSINARFENDFKEDFKQVLNSGHYILGNQVQAFEQAFATYCGTKHSIGVGNGLDALRLILEGYKILGKVKQGDEVLIAANTYIATIIGVKQAGLQPVLVEAEDTLYNFNLHALEAAITPKTKVIMPVHLYGQIAPMEAIHAMATKHQLLIIEDAAQAHGAVDTQSQKRAGNLGHAAGFSFYPSKNLGALGDGGAVTTSDDALAIAIKKLRNYGTSTKYVNEVLGINSRLDEIQAAFLSRKLKMLDEDNKHRQYIAKRYISKINNPKIKLPFYDESSNHVFHLFVVQVANRNHFMNYLDTNKVGHLIHYPIAPHQQEALGMFKNISLPTTEKIHQHVISIPMSPVMTEDQIVKVIEVVNAY